MEVVVGGDGDGGDGGALGIAAARCQDRTHGRYRMR
jgi:hypothetical protein